MSDLEEFDTAICRYCTEGLVVRYIRTGREFHGPFWRLAWTHADPQPGTDGTNCYAPHAYPDPSTMRKAVDHARPE
jgi:hypothetical protein